MAVFHGTMDIVFNSPVSGDLASIIGMLLTFRRLAVLLIYKPATLSRAGKAAGPALPLLVE